MYAHLDVYADMIYFLSVYKPGKTERERADMLRQRKTSNFLQEKCLKWVVSLSDVFR